MTEKNASGGAWINVLVATIALCICLVAVEGVLRIGHFLGGRAAVEERLFEYDALLGWKTKANLNTTVFGEARKISFVTNAKRLRGPEIPYERTPGERRILIL